ncbi:MAG: septum formation initiator family protein [Actinomycetota bacterium]|nr:septum formation initiator family protein [Actinomycetota bacterium]
MSTQHSGAARAGSTRQLAARAPELQVVAGSVVVRRGSGFVVVVAVMLVGGLVGLLLLNLSMQKGAFELAGLQARSGELKVQQQALDQQLERIQSTHRLALRATEHGMVPSANPMFLDLSDGSVIGEPVPAVAGQPLPGLGGREPDGPPGGPDTGSDAPAGTTAQRDVRGQTESPTRRRVD